MIRIVADIGNSACKLARMSDRRVEALRRLTHAEMRDSGALQQAFETLTSDGPPEEVVICSVVPALTEVLQGYCQRQAHSVLRVVAEDLPFMKLAYATLGTLGIDRYCNAVAAAGLYGAPCITVDTGTATTVNVVNDAGAYVGGAIGVGLRTGYEALHAYTAQLPALEPQWPTALVGVSTEESMHAGVTAIHVLGLKSMIERISSDFVVQPTVCFTGGNLLIIPREEFHQAVFEPDLLLKGAVLYSEAIKSQKS